MRALHRRAPSPASLDGPGRSGSMCRTCPNHFHMNPIIVICRESANRHLVQTEIFFAPLRHDHTCCRATGSGRSIGEEHVVATHDVRRQMWLWETSANPNVNRSESNAEHRSRRFCSLSAPNSGFPSSAIHEVAEV